MLTDEESFEPIGPGVGKTCRHDADKRPILSSDKWAVDPCKRREKARNLPLRLAVRLGSG